MHKRVCHNRNALKVIRNATYIKEKYEGWGRAAEGFSFC